MKRWLLCTVKKSIKLHQNIIYYIYANETTIYSSAKTWHKLSNKKHKIKKYKNQNKIIIIKIIIIIKLK